MRPDPDCVIVGAGLVGSIAALALAQRGFSVTIVDRRPRPAAAGGDVRALVLSVASIGLLESLGLWSGLRDDATPVTEVRVSERGAFGSVRLAAAEQGMEALGWSCPADAMLMQFHRALASEPRIQTLWATGFDAVSAGGAGLAIELEGASGRLRLAAPLLVGADGSDSSVRAACRIEVERRDYGQQAIVAKVAASCTRLGTAFEHFTSEGPLAFIPQGPERYVSIQCLTSARAEAALELDGGAYLAMLERRCGGRLGALRELGKRRAHELVGVRAVKVDAERTVLIGNAANAVHPNAAQGLNLGLRDASALANMLGRSAARADFAHLPAAYAAARRSDHAQVRQFTDVLARVFRSSLPPVRCGRRLALRVVGHSASLRQKLVQALSYRGIDTLAQAPPA